MRQLNLPSFEAKIRLENGKYKILDPIRRKYVALTPEEWVRQHFVNFLISTHHYPKEMIANEVSIRLNETSKRCDTVVYAPSLSPLMIVEYKAPTVELTPAVFEQIVRYDMVLHARYLIVSNGLRHICCEIRYEEGEYHFLEEIPSYNSIAY